MTVLITLTTAGADTGNFNLFSNVDGYTAAFAIGIAKSALEAGYISYVVPDGTAIVRVVSVATCQNYIDIPVIITTTTTTTIADPASSTLSFVYERGQFVFSLSSPIYSTNIVISYAGVVGSIAGDCSGTDQFDTITSENPVTLYSASPTASALGNTPINCGVTSYSRVNNMSIVGQVGPLTNGQVITIGGTNVTISIPATCETPYVCLPGTEWTVQYDVSSATICAAPGSFVYTELGSGIFPGVTIYTDPSLTIPLVGYSFIHYGIGLIYNLNSSTGVVGTSTATFC